ncbi:MAG: class I SAM-dependent methyltransferase [Oscillatoria sp. Prado101]|jgi:hypothetical protein|nr:class I SAM-dependent methyltransferase [Oscillatoria sp. Prado101]
MTVSEDGRRYAPATERNRGPILAVLQRVLPAAGAVLEIASGTGEHAVFFAPRLKPRFWLPSDPDPRARESIAAWRDSLPSENLYPPIDIDVREPVWGVEREGIAGETSPPLTAIVAINMIHISPWEATLGLLAGAGRILQSGGILYLYGAFKIGGRHTAPSNAAFDEMLRSQNPEWGVRDLQEVVEIAAEQNLTLAETVEMPANNFSVIFQRLSG